MKRTLSVILGILLVVSMLAFIVACDEDTTTQNPENTTDASVTTDATTIPDATEPDVTEPQGTEPEATDPEGTEPDENDPCANGHTYGSPEIIKNATCKEPGKKKAVCSVCQDELVSDIPATDEHEPKDEWDIVLEPSPDAEGKKVKKCKICGTELESQAIIFGNNIDLSSYSVIYDASITAKLFGSSANSLAQKIGRGATANSDSNIKNASATAKEILIGETDRPESAAALALLDTDGFAITYTSGKIAIVGTNSAQTLCGLNYFIEKHLDSNGNAAFLPDSTVKAITEIELISSKSFGYTFVYDADLSERDYIPSAAVDELISLMRLNSRLSSSSFVKKNDKVSSASAKEFIVGNVDRAEYLEILNTLDANEYAIAVVGNKVILAAWNVEAMRACISDFKLLFGNIKETVGSAKTWNLPDDFYAKGVGNAKWEVDFPRPDEADNIELTRSINANNDSLQFLYTGSGVNSDAFEAYCRNLVDAGYTLSTANTIENSIFRLYVNETKGIALNVAYNDYKHNSSYTKSIRVTSSPTDSITLPDSTVTTPNPTYVKVADSTITAMGLVHDNVGMCYIIRLEDGRFVIYDGGFNGAKDDIWKTLTKLHTEAYGEKPSASNPIHVAAWILTHSHADHISGCAHMINAYGSRDDFKMDYLVGTFPAISELYSCNGIDRDISVMGENGQIEGMQEAVNGGFKFIKSFTGQKLYFANLEIEILMTYEDHTSNIFNANDTSTVSRVSIASTSAAKGASTSAASAGYTTTALFLADAQRTQSRHLCAMYGSYLESEMVQFAHHGNNGCEIELYDTVRPKVILWPECREHIIMYSNPANINNGNQYKVDQHVIYELDSVKYVFGSDERYATTIKFTANGPDYDNFYDIWWGTKLNFDGLVSIKK